MSSTWNDRMQDEAWSRREDRKALDRERAAAAAAAKVQYRLVCAWCSTELRAGAEPASHGICTSCVAKFNSNIEESL